MITLVSKEDKMEPNNENKVNLWKNPDASDNDLKIKKYDFSKLKTPQDYVKALNVLQDINIRLQAQIYDLKNLKIPALEDKIKELESQSLNVILKRLQALEAYVEKDIKIGESLLKEAKTLYHKSTNKK